MINSGTANIALSGNQYAHGIFAGSIIVNGGDTTITNAATHYIYGSYAVNQFIMTGGSISATVSGGDSGLCALQFGEEASVYGGYGEFINTQTGYGAIWGSPSAGGFEVTGGHLVIASEDLEALYFNTSDTYIPKAHGSIMVSADSSGA